MKTLTSIIIISVFALMFNATLISNASSTNKSKKGNGQQDTTIVNQTDSNESKLKKQTNSKTATKQVKKYFEIEINVNYN